MQWQVMSRILQVVLLSTAGGVLQRGGPVWVCRRSDSLGRTHSSCSSGSRMRAALHIVHTQTVLAYETFTCRRQSSMA
jgi:hypothetical protein